MYGSTAAVTAALNVARSRSDSEAIRDFHAKSEKI